MITPQSITVFSTYCMCIYSSYYIVMCRITKIMTGSDYSKKNKTRGFKNWITLMSANVPLIKFQSLKVNYKKLNKMTMLSLLCYCLFFVGSWSLANTEHTRLACTSLQLYEVLLCIHCINKVVKVTTKCSERYY